MIFKIKVFCEILSAIGEQKSITSGFHTKIIYFSKPQTKALPALRSISINNFCISSRLPDTFS